MTSTAITDILTLRETEVLQTLVDCDGDLLLTTQRLYLSYDTVRTHLYNIYRKMGMEISAHGKLTRVLVLAIKQGVVRV